MEEIIKHHKKKSFNRKNMMDIAKIIRNLPISSNQRAIVYHALASYFESEDPFFDRKRFVQLATGQLNEDPKTGAYSNVKEKQDETEV